MGTYLLYLCSSLLCINAWSSPHFIKVTQAYAYATQGTNAAVYMTLYNPLEQAIALQGGESCQSTTVALHTHTHDTVNGQRIMRMRSLSSINIPPKSYVRLAPSGLHIMLMGLKERLRSNTLVPLTLRFSDGSTLSISIPVRARS